MLKHSLMLFPAILCHSLLQTSIAGQCASNLGESHETTSNNTPMVYSWAVSIQAACQHWMDMKNQGEDNCEAVSVGSAPPQVSAYPPTRPASRPLDYTEQTQIPLEPRQTGRSPPPHRCPSKVAILPMSPVEWTAAISAIPSGVLT